MMWNRSAKSGVDGDRVQGLREERKALAGRYTIDEAEAQRREELSAEVTMQQIADGEGPDRAAAEAEPVVSPRRDRVCRRRDPGAARYEGPGRAAAEAEPALSPRRDRVSRRRDRGAAGYVTGEGPGRPAAEAEPAVSPRRDRVSRRRDPGAAGYVIGEGPGRAA